MTDFNDELAKSKMETEYRDHRKPRNNFTLSNELTVTITLDEYRDLVSSKAIADKKNDELRDQNNDIVYKNRCLKEDSEKLQKQVDALKIKLYNLTGDETINPNGTDDNNDDDDNEEEDGK